MQALEILQKEYFELLAYQKFEEKDMDYSIVETHRPFLDKLAQVNNSAITVFDLNKKEHIYSSYNFSDIFGYDLDAISELGNDYFNSRVHPDDFIELMKNGITIMKFYYQLPKEERTKYKFVNEYRILGNTNKYIRVIEQHQSLELDKSGNLWLTLGVIDISPDQSSNEGIKSQVYKYSTGEIIPISFNYSTESSVKLSKREIEILQLVKDGLLSKEISEKLSISVHTVNTHRQRILEKLGANNSMEASVFASRFGLMS